MNLRIGFPAAIHEVGARDNNEDSIWPTLGQASDQDRLFLVCDGVGGNKRGEVASQLAAEGFARFFDEQPPKGPLGEEYLQAGLKAVEAQISAFLQTHPASKGMATTLTLLHLNGQVATIAWIGDSKVYHFRAGAILYETEDHSLVNQFIREGIISPEEAATHPHRNVITRAIKGEEPAEIDVHQIRDIQVGDIFLLCSDGITENWSSEDLATLTQAHPDPEAIRSAILTKSTGRTDDNFSAYLIQISGLEEEKIPLATVVESDGTESQQSVPKKSFGLSQLLKPIGIALVGAIALIALFFVFRSGHPDIDIRHKAEDALTEGRYVEAMYWADSLVAFGEDDRELLSKFKHLRDSVEERLLLWMNDSAESSTRLLGCQKLNGSVDTFSSKSLTVILQKCERKLDKADEEDWIEEGETWWKEKDFLKANMCMIEAKSFQEVDSVRIALAMMFLEKDKAGILKEEEQPLRVFNTLEKTKEYIEKEQCRLALKQYNKVAESLSDWKLDSLVNELIGIQACVP